MTTPEARAREAIDKKRALAGWRRKNLYGHHGRRAAQPKQSNPCKTRATKEAA